MKKYPLQTLGILASAISMISYMGIQNNHQKRTLNQEIQMIKNYISNPPKFKKMSIEEFKKRVLKK